jgi:hypothetical protein
LLRAIVHLPEGTHDFGGSQGGSWRSIVGNHETYWKDEALQARERALLTQRAKLEAEAPAGEAETPEERAAVVANLDPGLRAEWANQGGIEDRRGFQRRHDVVVGNAACAIAKRNAILGGVPQGGRLAQGLRRRREGDRRRHPDADRAAGRRDQGLRGLRRETRRRSAQRSGSAASRRSRSTI